MTDRIYCSEVAWQQDAEPAGTAVHVDVWLLLEYPRAWRAKALEDNELSNEATRRLAELEDEAMQKGVRLRTQFIKQAASSDRVEPTVFLCDNRGKRPLLLRGRLASYATIETLKVKDLLAGRIPRGEAVSQGIYLVCTNGQRDLCCARFGLPLYETLRVELGQRVWQTTHVGGHRFAPNLVCLPSSYVYAFVQPEIAADLTANHDQGILDLRRLRGRSCYPPAAQAAEIFLRRERDLRNLADVHIAANNGALTYYGAASGELVVEEQRLEAVMASCGKDPKAAKSYKLISYT